MAKIYEKVFFGDRLIGLDNAQLSVASSAVLYGLSVYTVFPLSITDEGGFVAFRLEDHFRRLTDSAKIIGIDDFEKNWDLTKFTDAIKRLVLANKPEESVFVRATVHVDDLVPGTRSRGLHTSLSIFCMKRHRFCLKMAHGLRLVCGGVFRTTLFRRAQK